MNRLSIADRTRVVNCLVEGCSIRSTCRMTGISKPTVLKLLADIGEACHAHHDESVRGLQSKRVQVDEVWSFVGAKQKNVTLEQMEAGWGGIWTWTALDADSKLIVSYLVGQRGPRWANAFMEDVASRVNSRIQITSDGHRAYADAVEGAFGCDVDYAMLIKLYGNDSFDKRYSLGECIGVQTAVLSGSPNPKHISTSFVERSNLSIRTSMRRMTRLTNGFSKKVQNHEAAIALNFSHYNYCKVYSTLSVTPAMQAGLTDHIWETEELVMLLEPKSILDGLTQAA